MSIVLQYRVGAKPSSTLIYCTHHVTRCACPSTLVICCHTTRVQSHGQGVHRKYYQQAQKPQNTSISHFRWFHCTKCELPI